MRHSIGYIFGFAAAVCVVCAVFVSASTVMLKDRQLANQRLDRQKKVLAVAGLLDEGKSYSAAEVAKIFDKNIVASVVNLETGAVEEGIDPATYDQRKASHDPDRSRQAPPNPAKVQRLPIDGLVFKVVENGKPKAVIVPIEGKGLWSTLYGYLALSNDTRTVLGITFYEHGETPGLGGEIENPRWQALWKGRKAYNEDWKPVITVKKGTAGPAATDPYEVDGLSGATITSRSVGYLVRFWLGKDGFGPYLATLRPSGGTS